MSATGGHTAGQLSGGLVRDRLTAVFADLWSPRLGLVIAPAGWGKTTLLSQVAALASVPTVWYRARDVDGDPQELLAQLERAFGSTLGPGGATWRSTREAAAAIEASASGRVLLIVDDLHELEGTPAERALERLVRDAPPSLAVLAASRLAPAWNLSRRRVSGGLAEVNADDLRFRSWEVERLFRNHFKLFLRPEDLARLSRYTQGWAAGLQLFHLAARDRPLRDQRELLDALGPSFRPVREYLIQNVLGELPVELRDFLVETCVLGRLGPELCDELRGTGGSGAMLEELERRQLVTFFLDGGPWYRCHEVLRSHLEAAYLETVTEAEARARYGWAASLLETAGALSEALRAYCRAGDGEAAARILGRKGDELASGEAQWWDRLPSSVVRRDPWFLLSLARRHRAAGRWHQALVAYRQAEGLMPAAGAGEVCRRERASVRAWIEPVRAPVSDWLGLLRVALTRDPMEIYRRDEAGADPQRVLVAGLAALVAGKPAAAAPTLARVAHLDGASPVLVAVSRLALATSTVLEGGGTEGVETAAQQLESLGIHALTRLTGVLAHLRSPDGAREAAEARGSCAQLSDPWGSAVCAFFEGWALLHQSGPDPAARAAAVLAEAAGAFARLDAPVLEAFATSASALGTARCGRSEARTEAVSAEAVSRALGVPGAQAVATQALVECTDRTDRALLAVAERLRSECGLAIPGTGAGAPVPAPDSCPTPETTVQCFGGFRLTRRGETVDLRPLRPKARQVLRLLAASAPAWVHREVIVEAVWPRADQATGSRNLQVVISSLRHLLEPESARGGSLLARQGQAYRLALPPGTWIDHVELDRALEGARTALAQGDRPAACTRLRAALELATGTFLPEDGPEEWVLPRREHFRTEVCSVAQALAEELLENGEAAEAAAVSRRALAVDRFSDSLWRLLVRACQAAGDVAAAACARRDYGTVLAELGIAGRDG